MKADDIKAIVEECAAICSNMQLHTGIDCADVLLAKRQYLIEKYGTPDSNHSEDMLDMVPTPASENEGEAVFGYSIFVKTEFYSFRLEKSAMQSDVEYLRQGFGSSEISVIQLYTHPSASAMKKALEKHLISFKTNTQTAL